MFIYRHGEIQGLRESPLSRGYPLPIRAYRPLPRRLCPLFSPAEAYLGLWGSYSESGEIRRSVGFNRAPTDADPVFVGAVSCGCCGVGVGLPRHPEPQKICHYSVPVDVNRQTSCWPTQCDDALPMPHATSRPYFHAIPGSDMGCHKCTCAYAGYSWYALLLFHVLLPLRHAILQVSKRHLEP